MTNSTDLWEEQVNRAKKLLENLPAKDSKKSRQEAASELVEDFKNAMKNGYTAAQISDILKNEGISIPVYLIKKVCKDEQKPEKKNKEKIGEMPETKPEQNLTNTAL